MRRLTCLVVLAGVSVLASAQDTSVKVTYTSNAARIGVELDAISKLANIPLTVAPTMENEVVLIAVKDIPLSNVMAKIGQVTSGVWEQSGSGYRLMPDPAMRRQESINSRLQRVKKLDDQIKKLMEPIDKKPQLTAANVGDDKLSGSISFGTGGTGMSTSDGSPTGRALTRILHILGGTAFADLEPGDRVVWASNPNRSQVALPSAANSAIQTLVAEQRVYSAANAGKDKKGQSETPEQAEASQQIAKMFGIDPEGMTKPLDGPPAKVLLTAARQSMFGSISISLLLFDAKGKVLLSSRNNLQVGGGFLDMADMADMAEEMKKPAPKPSAEKEIALSPLSKAMATERGAGGMNGGMLQAKIPDDLKKVMLTPDERDPLSFAESEATIALADSKGKAVVAELPDGILQLSITGIVAGQKLTLTSFAEKLRKASTVTDEDGFLVIKPTDPFDNRQTRLDRKALAQFLQGANGKEFVPLESLAQYALHNPEPTETPAATTYFMVFAPDALQSGIGGRADWNMLRLFATLPSQVRMGMERGSSMPLGNLTPEEVGYAARLLFGANAHLQVEDPNAAKSDLPNFFEQAISMFKMPTDYRSEPTEAMPNGFPRAGSLSLNLSVEPVMKSTSQGMMGMAALGLDELAMMQFIKDSPQFAQAQAFMPNLEQLKLGSRNIYNFKFRVSPGVSEAETLIDNSMPTDAPTVAMSNLPDSIKKELDARIAQFKKLPFFSPAFFGGGASPPPQ